MINTHEINKGTFMKYIVALFLLCTAIAQAANDCRVWYAPEFRETYQQEAAEKVKTYLLEKGYELSETNDSVSYAVAIGFNCWNNKWGCDTGISVADKTNHYLEIKAKQEMKMKGPNSTLEEVSVSSVDKAMKKFPECKNLPGAINSQQSKRKLEGNLNRATSWLNCLNPERVIFAIMWGMSCAQ
jgi:hypothetical protein